MSIDATAQIMTAEEVAARVTVNRVKDRDGHYWLIETTATLLDEEAARVTFRAAPGQVVMGEHVVVRDSAGDRIGHLATAVYREQLSGPACVTCTIRLR